MNLLTEIEGRAKSVFQHPVAWGFAPQVLPAIVRAHPDGAPDSAHGAACR